MSYRPPSKEPQTDWARFLIRQRVERDWSATQAFEALAAGLHLGAKSRTAYLPFEYNRKPTAAQERFLREFFGGGPTEADRAPVATPTAPPPPDEITSLVRALADLTEQNARLTARLEEHVEATTRMARDQVTTQEYLAAVLSVIAGMQAPAGFDTAGAIRGAADDLQARRLVTNGGR